MRLEAFFFPDNAKTALPRLLQVLGECQHELDLAIFALTDDRLANAVLECHKRGVVVRLIVDDQQACQLGADAKRLARAGLPVRHDNALSHMHHKFMVVDSSIVLTGSFNWTVRASKANREHFVFIHDEDLALHFKKEFDKLWCEFQDNVFGI